MEDTSTMLESLIEKATQYGQTSFNLAKLKALDKTSDVVSTILPHLVVFGFSMIFLLFLNLGLAFWLGAILGNTSFGFFAVGAFYGFTAISIRLFLFKVLKKWVGNNFINQVLK
jgi:hypothetical protein